MTTPTDFFSNTGTSSEDRNSASAAFKTIGDVIKGIVAEEPVVIDQTVYGTGAPKLDKNGKQQTQLVVVLQTEHRNWDKATNPAKDETGAPKPGAADAGLRALFVKFKLRDAIADALREAGTTTLEVGGELAVAYVSDEKFNSFDVKTYKAKYTPPAKSNSSQDFFGTTITTPADASAPPF